LTGTEIQPSPRTALPEAALPTGGSGHSGGALGGLVRVARSPRTARALLPVVVLAFWFVSIEIIRSIWPFAVDVLPSPIEVAQFMWAEIQLETLAPTTSTPPSGSRCNGSPSASSSPWGSAPSSGWRWA
jgi:hypothetical protein